jgi:hypothetical protein
VASHVGRLADAFGPALNDRICSKRTNAVEPRLSMMLFSSARK